MFGLEYIFNFNQVVNWYVQPVAGGIGIYSFYKAHRDVGKKCPKILGIQADICSPMVNAWISNSPTLQPEHIPNEIIPSDFFRVLKTRHPGEYHVLKRIMDKVDGRFESVSDNEIYEAIRLFYTEEYFIELKKYKNIAVGLEPATDLAGAIKGVKEGYIRTGKKVLLNVSGAAKEGDVKEEWIQLK